MAGDRTERLLNLVIALRRNSPWLPGVALVSGHATVLAVGKLEELRGLAFGFDESGASVTDLTGDTRYRPARASGGTGLRVSPPGTLTSNVDGYYDVIDVAGGQWPRLDAAVAPQFIRR